jgi:hypothetical protein
LGKCCRKPARAGFKQTIPTTGNVHVFDTFMRLRDDPSIAETPEIRFLDVEGLDGTRHILPVSHYENILKYEMF